MRNIYSDQEKTLGITGHTMTSMEHNYLGDPEIIQKTNIIDHNTLINNPTFRQSQPVTTQYDLSGNIKKLANQTKQLLEIGSIFIICF